MDLETKQYWADAATRNCVWLFQIKRTECNKDHGCSCGAEYNEEGDLLPGSHECRCEVSFWDTHKVFLTREEANRYGELRPYAWGKKGEGWRIYGVPCDGMMVRLLGQHGEEFENMVEHLH